MLPQIKHIIGAKRILTYKTGIILPWYRWKIRKALPLCFQMNFLGNPWKIKSSILNTRLKPCTHDQICIRMQILHICKICVRTQIWPCVRIYSRMQNLHVCKSWKICSCLRPSANLILRIRKICVYANLVM